MDIIISKTVHKNTAPLVTVSSSFNRFLKEIQEAVEELEGYGAYVLSPRHLKPHSLMSKQFILLEGDLNFPHATIKEVQDRHHRCIEISHFLWLVCPGGYTGNSTTMEIGYAIAAQVPIYSCHMPSHPRIARYVTLVAHVKQAIETHRQTILLP